MNGVPLGPLEESLGSRLRELRGEVTQRDFGRAIGMSASAVCLIELGRRRVTLIEFVRWCSAAGASVPREVKRLAAMVAASEPAPVDPRQQRMFGDE